MSRDFLAAMAASSRERVAAARALRPDAELKRLAVAVPAPPPLTLSDLGFDLIADLKLRSPAVGALAAPDISIPERVSDYADAGAAAISVLTEPTRFDGAIEHVSEAVGALAGRIPVMRKDFLVDWYQVYEARLAGAGGVLIILRMLPRAELASLIDCAADLGMFALLEAFDAADLALASELVRSHASRASLLVGVNCRDLTTLQVVPHRLDSLAALLPRDVPHVAESGVTDASDAARVASAGYNLALVGSALMKSSDPAGLASMMLEAGRDAASAAAGQ